MDLSWRLARVAGIDLRLHYTLPLLLLLAPSFGRTLATGVLLVAAVLVFVALHELGHALVARRLGVPVKQIVLTPIGGMAAMEGRPSRPSHELAIALAGPAVNLVLAAVFLGVGAGWRALGDLSVVPTSGSLWGWMAALNLGLALFNLLPAFPMDGGRALRAVLAMKVGDVRATAVAITVGRGIAVLMGAYALATGQVGLALISAFVFFGGRAEQRAESARTLLSRVPVGRLVDRDLLALAPGSRAFEAADLMLRGRRHLAVVLGEQLLGVLSREGLRAALARGEAHRYVAGLMRRDVPRVERDASLEQVHAQMVQARSPVVAVIDGGAYVGLVDAADIAEALRWGWFRAEPGPSGREAPA